MIRTSNKVIDKTIQYLNSKYSTKEDVYIKIAEGYDVIEANQDGDRGFGVFDADNNVIVIASEMEDEELIRTISHEYRHFMQKCNGAKKESDYDEKDAEEFSDKILNEIKEKDNNNVKIKR